MPPAAARERGAIRLYLGYAAGCGITTAMLEEAGRRRSRGSDVVVAAVDCRGREGVNAALDGLELIGDGTALDADTVLARQPEVVCIDDCPLPTREGRAGSPPHGGWLMRGSPLSPRCTSPACTAARAGLVLAARAGLVLAARAGLVLAARAGLMLAARARLTPAARATGMA